MKIPFLSIFDEDGNIIFVNLMIAIFAFIAIAAVATVVLRQAAFDTDVATQKFEVNDPDRVQDLSTQVLNRYHGLESNVSSIVSLRNQRDSLVEGLGARSTWPLDIADRYTQMNQQLLQSEVAFHDNCEQYLSFLADPSRTIAVPHDLPRTCPELPAE